MSIVMISESLLLRVTATDGRILRDRVLSGFGVRLNARKRTFLITTSVSGKQFRMMLGFWPLMSVDEARSRAMDVLRQCRNGERPSRRVTPNVPTLADIPAAFSCAGL
jgi:hypothetical protein